MARRLPSQPPNLPGFSYVRVLGSGGFADVFLYEQNLPRRQVAVKVMLAEVVTSQVRQMFQAEANLMAQLSTHPSILTVYQASVSADGRPYLVMELCSAAIGQRYRTEPLPVPTVLSIGIRIASAVETAHRAGVLHRDIKPSNILTTVYGHPVLSDFGIAATLGEADITEAIGLSIPWSAPEVLLDETSGTIASEVWALGATIYSLLAGRSPFEVPGKENTSAELISRITRGRPQPIDRADVPPRLVAVLERAMSKKPNSRQHSVLELIRELQAVETELGLAADADRSGDGRLGARDGGGPGGPHAHQGRGERSIRRATSAAAGRAAERRPGALRRAPSCARASAAPTWRRRRRAVPVVARARARRSRPARCWWWHSPSRRPWCWCGWGRAVTSRRARPLRPAHPGNRRLHAGATRASSPTTPTRSPSGTHRPASSAAPSSGSTPNRARGSA